MPVRDVLPGRRFDTETLGMMNDAYGRVLGALGVKDRSDPITKLIAEKMAALVDAGILDGDRVFEQTIAAFKK